jgi:hypothetical protein
MAASLARRLRFCTVAVSRNSSLARSNRGGGASSIAAAVAVAKRERSEATKVDAEWVLRRAVELHQRCMQEIRPVRNPRTGKQQCDDEGNAIFKFNAAAAGRALELVGKHVSIRAFRDQVEVSNGLILVERIRAGREQARIRNIGEAKAS